MGAAPNRCPVCGEVLQWKLVDTSNKGFSVGKAAVGLFCLAPLSPWRSIGQEKADLLLR